MGMQRCAIHFRFRVIIIIRQVIAGEGRDR